MIPSSPPTGSSPPASQRLYHLDALRSFAILYGLFVHTATLGVSWPLTLVSDVSGYFRMGTFFLVSGFFSAMVLRRTGSSGFLAKRALALLVPFVCGVALLNPLTNWLIWNWHNPALPLADYLRQAWDGTLPPGRGPMVWHLHLWFLISLSFYAATAPIAVASVRRMQPAAGRLAEGLAALPGWLCVMVVAAGIAMSALGLRIGYELVIDPFMAMIGAGRAVWLVRNSLYYWPMFLTGMVVFHHAGFAAKFQTVSLPALILGLGAVIVVRETVPRDGNLWEMMQILSRAFLTTAAIAALMALFRRWFAKAGLLSRSAEAIYSIYILHFLVIYVVATALRPLGLGQTALFLVVAVLSFGVVFALHHLVIRPVPILSLMFNGKPLARRRAGHPTAMPRN